MYIPGFLYSCWNTIAIFVHVLIVHQPDRYIFWGGECFCIIYNPYIVLVFIFIPRYDDHKTILGAISKFEWARKNRDWPVMVRALKEASTFLLDPDQSLEERHLMVEVYDHLRQGSCCPWVIQQTPNFIELRDCGLHAKNRAGLEAYQGHLGRDLAEELTHDWREDGKARRMDLLIHHAEIWGNTELSREASWKYRIFNQEPRFIPGNKAAFLLSGREVGGDLAFDCCHDGESIVGAAARSFLPVKVIHEEVWGPFFCLGGKEFAIWMEKLRLAGNQNSLDFLMLMLGHEDMKVWVERGESESAIFDCVCSRLCDLRKVTDMPVIFGGVPVLGSLKCRKLATRLNQRLFQDVARLRSLEVSFLDCVTPSRLANERDVFHEDWSLRSGFKAACYYALSRVMAMTYGNLGSPVPEVFCSPAEGGYLDFLAERRAIFFYPPVNDEVDDEAEQEEIDESP